MRLITNPVELEISYSQAGLLCFSANLPRANLKPFVAAWTEKNPSSLRSCMTEKIGEMVGSHRKHNGCLSSWFKICSV
jgi:hypothetical protein